jgi:ribonuclease HI
MYVYTDGACSNNGRTNAMAGIGIYFGDNDPRNVSRRITGQQTNNAAELTAIIDVYPLIETDENRITIVSDSEYAIRCVSSYGEKCQKTNWTKDIPNKELVKRAYTLYKNKSNVEFMHVRAHTNKDDVHSIGNHNADRLANEAIQEMCKQVFCKRKIYLNVPFLQKDAIKQMGGCWDFGAKKWYIYDNHVNKDEIIEKFLQ